MRFTLAPELSPIVRPGVLWLADATVVDREPRLTSPLAAAEAAVRTSPPAETAAVRSMYKRVGLDPTKTRPSSAVKMRMPQHAHTPSLFSKASVSSSKVLPSSRERAIQTTRSSSSLP